MNSAHQQSEAEVCMNLIARSPAFQLPHMLSMLQPLAPETLTPAFMETAATSYNATHPRVAVTNEGEEVLVCEAARVKEKNHFLKAKSSEVFHVNPVTLEAVISSTLSAPAKGSKETLRLAVESKLESYMSERFPGKKALCGVYSSNQGNVIHICIIAENESSRNLWSGIWCSQWQIDSLKGEIGGNIDISAHYYENGNTQLATRKEVSTTNLSSSSEAEYAEKVVAFISFAEEEVHAGLDAMIVNLDEETFKAIRRTMPITRTKMDWSVNAVRMNRMVMRK